MNRLIGPPDLKSLEDCSRRIRRVSFVHKARACFSTRIASLASPLVLTIACSSCSRQSQKNGSAEKDVETLMADLKAEDVGVRKEAAQALRTRKDKRAIPALIETYRERQYESFLDALSARFERWLTIPPFYFPHSGKAFIASTKLWSLSVWASSCQPPRRLPFQTASDGQPSPSVA